MNLDCVVESRLIHISILLDTKEPPRLGITWIGFELDLNGRTEGHADMPGCDAMLCANGVGELVTSEEPGRSLCTLLRS